ncbi:MAG: nitrogenase cofactor biosynthesis protein NifB [Desulfococcaceae bacterium]|jgi:nitrogen fixation protein NifB|nr:nitrogenase cofactor biosynthesis protein NifB [Desulfococcaceae bacterium]
MNFENHPCFHAKAHKKFGRVHLPVAPRCNIQCKFCNRKFDCVNESRPGVTSGILTPYQAMVYLEEVFRQKKNISVVGIAGPGDPFANPEETLETLRRVREKYPDMMLCVATNGLNISPYIDELAELKVSHITVTVNAVDPEVGAKIYSWVRYNKRVMQAEKGVEILLKKQIEAIKGLKEKGITVKVNSIIIPGINEDHIETVARKMSEMDVDILNCVPYYPNAGSSFEHLEEPSKDMIHEVREKAGKYIKQMRHCTRCRADAVGLLGEVPDAALMDKLQACEQISKEEPVKKQKGIRSRVAVASMEGVLVNQHLGEASKLLIYDKKDGMISLLEARNTPPAGGGFQRWAQLADTLSDCGTLLVSGIGENPKRVLSTTGLDIMEIEGVIDEAVRAVFEGQSLKHLIRREMKACGAGCSGTGGGCG